jgi:hypothetical protein
LGLRIHAHLEAKDLWLDQGEGFAVDFDEAFAFPAVGDRGSYILSVQVHLITSQAMGYRATGILPYQSSSCRSTAHSEGPT